MAVKIKSDTKGIDDFLTRSDTMGKVDNTKAYMKRLANTSISNLENSSPKDTGNYASGWTATINADGFDIKNQNRDTSNGEDLTMLLEFGHGTRNGGYVNPRRHVEPEFEHLNKEINKLAKEVFK